jgi:hypothetical protein
MAERYIPEHRRTQFKAKSTFKPEELRRRREEQQVEIRKAKREENLAKRRGIGTGDDRPGASLGAAPDSDDENPPSESQVCCHSYPIPNTHVITCHRVSAFKSCSSHGAFTPLVPRRLLWSLLVRPGPHSAPPALHQHHRTTAILQQYTIQQPCPLPARFSLHLSLSDSYANVGCAA